jgi:hypothetical protein
MTGWLNHIDVMSTDALLDLHVQFAVSETPGDASAQFHAKFVRNARRERYVG